MDVPFISSGAMSRAHYALVRKVELATSLPAADQVLLAEIESVHDRLTGSALSEVSSPCALYLSACLRFTCLLLL